jgi:hypothetical protein
MVKLIRSWKCWLKVLLANMRYRYNIYLEDWINHEIIISESRVDSGRYLTWYRVANNSAVTSNVKEGNYWDWVRPYVRMCVGSVCFSYIRVFYFPCRKCTKWKYKREKLVSKRIFVLCTVIESFTVRRILVAWISFWFVSIQFSPLFKIKLYHFFQKLI